MRNIQEPNPLQPSSAFQSFIFCVKIVLSLYKLLRSDYTHSNYRITVRFLFTTFSVYILKNKPYPRK